VLRKLFVNASMLALTGSMPAFASAGVEQGHVPNEVIPTKMLSNGTSCPQLDFGHKVVEKSMVVQVRDTFTAGINSLTWNVSVNNMNIVERAPEKTEKRITMFDPRQKGECRYSATRGGVRVELTMTIKHSDEAVKAAHIKSVTGVIEKIKAAGVVSRAELLEIINKVMP
jgi:hypothetical protein